MGWIEQRSSQATEAEGDDGSNLDPRDPFGDSIQLYEIVDPRAREIEEASMDLASPLPPPSSTKKLQFPDEIPYFRIDFQYMDIWEPHSLHPSTLGRTSLWGAWEESERSAGWVSIIVFAKHQTASSVQKRMFQILQSSDFSTDPTSHWVHLLQALYSEGIANARRYVRHAVKKLDILVRNESP